MKGKRIVSLGSVQKTLLLPLWGRAEEAQKRKPLLVDATAVDVVGSIDYDFSTIARNMSPITQLAWIARSLHIDRTIRQFLEQHPTAALVNIGCGLDTTFERVDNGSIRCYDLDLPDVIQLRREFLPEHQRRQYVACSVFDTSWFTEVDATGGVVFMAAGVLYYFQEDEVKDLLIKLAEKFPGAELVFDAASPLGVQTANKKVLAAGGMDESSVLQWGIRDPYKLQRWDNRIAVLEEYPLFKGIKRHLSVKDIIGTTISDILRIMFIVHVAFRRK